ncbi:hypothetical protein BHE74_00047280 [Ensete ventricosum]|nr:hypothetical protein BHE74_00047280 [Ensete ventricosum]
MAVIEELHLDFLTNFIPVVDETYSSLYQNPNPQPKQHSALHPILKKRKEKKNPKQEVIFQGPKENSSTDLEMERAATELGLALVVELHPRVGLVKARAFPLEVVLGGGGRTHEGGEEVNGAAEGPEDGPRRPVGEEGEQIHGTEGGLPRARIVPVPEKRGRVEENKGRD